MEENGLKRLGDCGIVGDTYRGIRKWVSSHVMELWGAQISYSDNYVKSLRRAGIYFSNDEGVLI